MFSVVLVCKIEDVALRECLGFAKSRMSFLHVIPVLKEIFQFLCYCQKPLAAVRRITWMA